MSKSTIILEANDCSPFENQEGHGEAIQHFLSLNNNTSVFQFELNDKFRIDESPVASFNYSDGKWYAGRYIGESSFTFKKLDYKIVIRPRFGNLQLFNMLEEVFNIRLTESHSLIEKKNDFEFIIKRIIAFLWLNMMSKANKHGLPRVNDRKTYKGSKIRGKLNVRRSIISLNSEDKIVSNYWEKTVDKKIVKVLKTSYEILKKDYNISSVKSSLGARNALEQLFSAKVSPGFISDNEFSKIEYKNIYKSFKSVVDLSWDIIKRKNFGNHQDSDANGISFFLDMAEIWELYLKSIMKKRLVNEGWALRNDIIRTYSNKDFKRTLIPDIVFQRGNDMLVWDAKYKRMKFKYFDYDRADFFQIHTYINYYNQHYNVIAGGLLYPLSEILDEERKERNNAKSLFSEGSEMTSFVIDGIDYKNLNADNLKDRETDFLDRISKLSSINNINKAI